MELNRIIFLFLFAPYSVSVYKMRLSLSLSEPIILGHQKCDNNNNHKNSSNNNDDDNHNYTVFSLITITSEQERIDNINCLIT